jgi:3-isopropylmalate/(R)-2-methylmalate dehydratase small subunit
LKESEMHVTGKAHKVGAHIDTDAIIPARFLVTTDPLELGVNCMEGLEPGWIKRVSSNDILVAEENFGCGSSREHAPLALLGAGIPVVIAKSFARIFYRNGFNMGLILLEVGDGVDRISDGDRLEVDTGKGSIRNLSTGEEIQCTPVPPFMQRILDAGGLIPYVRERLEAKG